MMKQAYFFVNELDKDGCDELVRFFDLLKSSSYEEIYAKHFKLGTDDIKDNSTFWYGTNLEVFLFSKYLYDKGVQDFHVLYKPELFIYNEQLFIIKNNSIEELDIEDTGFFTLRTEFNHPFYEVLDILLKKKWGTLNKPTKGSMDTTNMERNKFFGIIKLYPERERFIGDIIIPFGIRDEHYWLFLEWMKVNFHKKIVLKKEGYQCCNGITMIDLEIKTNEENIKRASFALDDQLSCLFRPYILPYYSFKTEYRIYFIKSENDTRFYSAKQKHLYASQEDIFSIQTLSESMKFDWSCIPRGKWEKIEHIFTEARSMVDLMEFETGTLEFGENEKGDIIFFEVNPMGSPMMYHGEDEKDIHEYYMNLFSLITKNIVYE